MKGDINFTELRTNFSFFSEEEKNHVITTLCIIALRNPQVWRDFNDQFKQISINEVKLELQEDLEQGLEILKSCRH